MKVYLEILLNLARRYPSWEFTPASAAAWAEDLADITPEVVAAACRALSRESEMPPSLAGIRKRAEALTAPASTALADAWGEVMRNRELHSRSRYESRPERMPVYRWSSPAVERAAEAIQWRSDWEGEARGVIRAQFERYLAGLRDEARYEAARVNLPNGQRRLT